MSEAFKKMIQCPSEVDWKGLFAYLKDTTKEDVKEWVNALDEMMGKTEHGEGWSITDVKILGKKQVITKTGKLKLNEKEQKRVEKIKERLKNVYC